MNKINATISNYINLNIVPEYKHFDKAHNIDHVKNVISNSLSISKGFDINANMIYVIAAYHDIGLKCGRQHHEIASANCLRLDINLQTWFSKEEINLMADAIEDHRASIKDEPRTIYGKIVADADRDIDYFTILTRTMIYGIENFPTYDFEQHLERTIKHLQEKYGEGGYLKLWMDVEYNNFKLENFRKNLKSKHKLKNDLRHIYQANLFGK